MITSNGQLKELCSELEQGNTIGIDTEFKRVNTYFPELCLIQLAFNNNFYIIDPLSIDDFRPLVDLFPNNDITWVFHSAEQDLEALYQKFNKTPHKIFDTQIAANFLNFKYQISYQSIVEEIFNVFLEKKFTRIDWSTRPLKSGPEEYAIDDVRYLLGLKKELDSLLKEQSKLSIVYDEFSEVFSKKNYEINIFDSWKKLKGFSKLNKKNIKFAFALAAWRESLAIKFNKPRRWILKDEKIIEIVMNRASLEPKHRVDFDKFYQENNSMFSELNFNTNRYILNKSEQSVKVKIQSSLHTLSKQYNLKNEVLFNKKMLIKFIKLGQKANSVSGWRYSLLKKELLKWETF